MVEAAKTPEIQSVIIVPLLKITTFSELNLRYEGNSCYKKVRSGGFRTF